jgi:hypothetical protein
VADDEKRRSRRGCGHAFRSPRKASRESARCRIAA